ncbi:MAG: hypothetical protein HOO92_01525 [Methylococcaceae bacterium]|nr:hypothetical protein [Methylococcaceae bacterium]
MSELKSRPPVKAKPDLDDFLSGAEKKTAQKPIKQQKAAYPWEEAGIRDDVTKVYNLRLPEAYLLKLKFIAEHSPGSMHKFCLNVVQEAIDAKINELTK